jgi:hypothetical protein
MKLARLELTIIVMLFVILLIQGSVYADENYVSVNIQPLKEGLSLVETFYKHLTSNIPAEKCPQIFTNCYSEIGTDPEARKDALKYEWEFIRSKKRLFISDAFLNSKFYKPSEFFAGAPKGYYFMNPPDPEHLSEYRQLYIVLNVSTGELDGIWKQIAFPIDFVESRNEYAISLLGIKVNGAIIEIPYKHFTDKWERNFDWFYRMGFREKSIIDFKESEK